MSVRSRRSPGLLSRTTILLTAITPCTWQPGPTKMAVLIAALGFVAFVGLETAAHRRHKAPEQPGEQSGSVPL
jgi:hypothetical protein